jgi:hypothetical protein
MEIGQFASKSFAFRDQLHILHLKTKSYSEHKALGNAYEFILDWLDGFLEAWQGFDSLINFDAVTIESNAITNPVFIIEDYIGEVLMKAKTELAEDMSTYGFFVNELETAIFSLYQTIYKLKNLK